MLENDLRKKILMDNPNIPTKFLEKSVEIFFKKINNNEAFNHFNDCLIINLESYRTLYYSLNQKKFIYDSGLKIELDQSGNISYSPEIDHKKIEKVEKEILDLLNNMIKPKKP